MCAHGDRNTLARVALFISFGGKMFVLVGSRVSFKPVKSYWCYPTVKKGSNLRTLNEVELLNILCDDRRKKQLEHLVEN